MTYNTIDNDVTMAGGAGGALGRIDKYELRRELGEGGFGTVYLARDTVADVDVAVKGLPPEVKHNESELESIRRNFALVKRLRHPNIVAVTDLHQALSVSYASKDVESKLRVFERDTMVVMDYAPGVTLAQWRRQFPGGKVPLDKAIAVTRQVASALDYAHGQKVLHRDVKPANVMVESADGGKLVARVLDFGLAAEIRSSMGRLSHEIRDTSGTRPYMAPEQWKGERQGPATDQYALAAMFYELVVGDVPFASVFDCGDPAVMRLAVTTDAPAIPADLPKCVRRALSVALAKKPEERFSSCGEFAAALEGKRVSRRGAETQRKGGAGKVLAALALLAAIGVGGMLYHQNQERQRAEQTVQETESAKGSAAKGGKNEMGGPKAGDIKTLTLPGGATMDFVWCPPGAFIMGSPVSEKGRNNDEDDETQHNVTLTRGFWIGKYEVTQHQWTSVMNENPSYNKGDTHPVEYVSWNDCQEFISRINEVGSANVDFPTEAQWEYAARGGPFSKGYVYSGGNRLNDVGWYLGNSGRGKYIIEADEGFLDKLKVNNCQTHSVFEGKQCNELGIFGMSGNVHEWCRDWYGKYDVNVIDPHGPTSGVRRVMRGGNWYHPERYCRVAGRNQQSPDHRNCGFGLRLVINQNYPAQRAEAERREREAREVAERERRAKWRQEGAAFTINDPYGLNLTMKWCPAGTFIMGSPTTEEGRYDNERQHQVTLSKGFWLGETEVTQGQWKKLMDGETVVDLARKGLRDDTVYNIAGKQQTLREFWGMSRGGDPMNRCGDQKDDVPVYNVSWNEAVEFCRRLTQRERAKGLIPDGYEYRLPTEAEWEYACRAGTTAALPNGRDIRILGANNAPALDDISWYAGNSSVGFDGRGWDTSGWPEKQYPGGRACARDVRGKKANRWGLYDMIGNVWEWCGDWYGDYPYGSVSDPAGATTGACRVDRGGGWDDDARRCRCADRGGNSPGVRGSDLGFRVALAPSH